MMEISWDGVPPTQEQWDALGGHAFVCLEDINEAQMAILTRAMLELLCHMGHPQTSSANLMKPRMAALIAGALATHDGWAASELGNIHSASSSRDSVNLSSLAFGLELISESPVRLFFPAGGIVPVAENGPENEAALLNADAAAAQQPSAPDLVTILVTMQKQTMTMQQGFAQQTNTITALKDELKTEFKGHLTSLAKHMAEKVTRLE